MRKLVAGLFITFDGVIEAPGPKDLPPFQYAGWSLPYFNDEVGAHIGAQTAASDALLLGRKTYETFEAAFGNSSDPQSEGMSNFPKYVVSNTLKAVTWKNSTLINGNVVEEVTRLKNQPGRDIAVSGSGTLLQTLMRANLVDEFSLLVHPVVLGMGKKLFNDYRADFTLTEARPLNTGVVIMTYALKR